MTLIWLLLSSLCYAVGEYFSKRWSESLRYDHLAFLFMFYLIGIALWLPAIRETQQLAVTGMLWLILSIAAFVGLGVFWFGESLYGMQWIGLVLAVIACALLSMK